MISRSGNDLFEFTLSVRSDRSGRTEVLKAVLKTLGFDEFRIVESAEWPYTRLSLYFGSKQEAGQLACQIRALNLKDVESRVHHLTKKDWATKWKEEFRPFNLTKTITVIPRWLKGKYRLKGKMGIYIDTDVAFGTGLHPTTRYMAQFVERLRGKVTTVLDVGCGTGILSIVASKCGANQVDAVDISSNAVKVARRNIKDNRCPGVKVSKMDAHRSLPNHKYDLVCANIITEDLVHLAAKLIKRVAPGKYLAVSGVSIRSYQYFRERYSWYALKCLKVEKGDGWTGLLFKKITARG